MLSQFFKSNERPELVSLSCLFLKAWGESAWRAFVDEMPIEKCPGAQNSIMVNASETDESPNSGLDWLQNEHKKHN